jgi:predicted metalloprotease with PDZ domain
MNRFIVVIVGLLACSVYGQDYNYTADLKNCKKDKIHVELKCPSISKEEILFHFPMTIPGTYDILNYGNYISKFTAIDREGNKLKVERVGVNSFKIFNASSLSLINYTVEDSWDSGEKKNKIFEPAGTGFFKDECFFINNAGLFGFFEGMLNEPFNVQFIKPSNLEGFSSLNCVTNQTESQYYLASDYYQLVDNPILFTAEKPVKFQVANAEICIASYYKNSDSTSIKIQHEIDSSMQAIEKFVGGELPITQYNFLSYIADMHDVGKILLGGNIKWYHYPKLILKMKGQGFGALEHNTSSSYYLPDFGHDSYVSMVSSTAIHEFMHIYTPLSLHSNLIGDFDYVNPQMSKHLWLYEGITEYFANLIAMQGGIESQEDVIKHHLKDNIVMSYQYPDSIPFTTMSEHVFEKEYHKLYGQVYVRGTIMGMLLDFEIMRLTNGEKTLKHVINELISIYGQHRSFMEEELIPQFVQLVHPDLQQFFDDFVLGTKPLEIQKGFELVGIDYQKEKKGRVPYDLLSEENGVKPNLGIVINNKISIKKASKTNLAGFIKGDKVDRNEVIECFKNADGTYLEEGAMIELNVERKGKLVTLKFPAQYSDGVTKNYIEILPEMNESQRKFFTLWTTGS